MISSQPDFIKVMARFQVDPQAFMIYYRLLSSKIYFFAAFHLAPTAEEPEIFTASKPFAIFSKIFFADSDSRVLCHGYHSYPRSIATNFCVLIEQLFLYILICEAFF